MRKTTPKQEELETTTAVQAPEPPEPKNKIYVAFLYGKKGKHDSRVIRAHFDEIETEEQLANVANYLSQSVDNQPVTILNWKSLEG